MKYLKWLYKIQQIKIIYYYRFIVRFPIGFDFLSIPFVLHFCLPGISSLSILCYATSVSTLSNHVPPSLQNGNLPSPLNPIHFFTQSSPIFPITCPYHLSLPPPMTVVICSTPTSILNFSFVLLSFMETPHSHLIICISALSNFNPTSARKGLVFLPYVMLLLTHSTFRLYRGSSGCQKWQTLSELHSSIYNSSCSSKIRSTISIKSVSQITKALYTSICLSIYH